MECFKILWKYWDSGDTRKIKMLSNLPILISKFIEYELCLSEFHLTMISQTVRKLSKVFN